MTDSQKLDLLLSEMREMKGDVQELKTEVRQLKTEVRQLKADVQQLKSDVQQLKSDVQQLKTEVGQLKADVRRLDNDIQALNVRVTTIELHLENTLNPNIQLLAENHSMLVNRINQASSAADASYLYGIKINYFVERVHRLEKDMDTMKKTDIVAA